MTDITYAVRKANGRDEDEGAASFSTLADARAYAEAERQMDSRITLMRIERRGGGDTSPHTIEAWKWDSNADGWLYIDPGFFNCGPLA